MTEVYSNKLINPEVSYEDILQKMRADGMTEFILIGLDIQNRRQAGYSKFSERDTRKILQEATKIMPEEIRRRKPEEPKR